VTLAQLNAVDEPLFVAAIGPVFEHSPWIAAAAWKRRPFATVQALHNALAAVVDEASQERQVALIAAHPDLAGRVAREGRLTAASREEQASAGLPELTETERALFDVLNAAYRARFAFPFVICAREHSKASILSEIARRAGHDRAVEIAAAIDEIKKIAWLRLIDVVVESA
jgi:2-oxo-4-hydroxy-4-carboxy-5-ureidoimidazoline decarboxylase